MNNGKDKTLAHRGTATIEVKKSKFYGFAYPVTSREEIDKILNALKSEFSDASHVVYVFRLGIGGAQEYFTDAGEPSGTAGAPIIRTLKGRSITNTLVAVVRYFGGTKLGTGGLARAYGETARLAIENAGVMQFITMVVVIAKIPYGAVSQWALLIDGIGGVAISQKFEKEVFVEAKIPKDEFEKVSQFVAEVTRGAKKLTIIS